MSRKGLLALLGGLALLLISGRGGAPSALAVPANDNFANAIAIATPSPSGIVAVGDNVGALLEAGEPGALLCTSAPYATVWYTWTSPASPGTVVFDTFGSSVDTELVIYTGSALNALTERGCNDDFGAVGPSAVALTYTASTTYRIKVGSFNPFNTGNITLSMSTGAEMVVNTTADNTTIDSSVTLREAMLLARGGSGAGGLSRALTASEGFVVLNAGAAGSGSSDLIHFQPATATIFLSSSLPDLSATGDVVSGIGSGVVVNGNAGNFDCFTLSGNSNHIEGLQITNCSGASNAINVPGGSNVIGGTMPSQANVISGNALGVSLFGPGGGNKIIGNYIGTDNGGLNALVNSSSVLVASPGNIIGGAAPGEGNVIVASNRAVAFFGSSATSNIVKGNKIGTDSSGTRDITSSVGAVGIYIDAPNNVIGGSGPGDGNLISGNGTGVFIKVLSTNNSILGNRIGTDDAGISAVPNDTGIDYDGVMNQPPETNFIGGSASGAGNIISGNAGPGIELSGGVGAVIKGNKIGVNAAGGGLPNGTSGITMFNAVGNVIGGVAAGEGNAIAFNTGDGVALANTSNRKITIRGNSIHSNGGMGISIVPPSNDGVAPPVIGSATATLVTGAACPLCTVDLYNDASYQGRIYLGSTTADGAGTFSMTVGIHSLPTATATATDANGNTSQFSGGAAWPANSDGDGIPDASDPCPLAAEDVDGFQDGDGCPDPDNDVDGVCDPGQVAVSCTGSDTGKMVFDPAGTISAPTLDCRNLAEDYDGFKDTDGCPEPDNDNDGFPDATDACLGTGSQAGADGMLGSPQDLNHNGIKDVSEATLTSDDVVLTFEDNDGVLDTDGCHDSPGADFDADGFTDDNEALFIGTDPGYPCGNGGWPADLVSTGISANKLTLQDVTSFLAPAYRLNTSPGDGNFSARWDLVPGRGIFAKFINLQDLTAIIPSSTASTARPPMFNGAPAMNQTCPYPPQ